MVARADLLSSGYKNNRFVFARALSRSLSLFCEITLAQQQQQQHQQRRVEYPLHLHGPLLRFTDHAPSSPETETKTRPALLGSSAAPGLQVSDDPLSGSLECSWMEGGRRWCGDDQPWSATDVKLVMVQVFGQLSQVSPYSESTFSCSDNVKK